MQAAVWSRRDGTCTGLRQLGRLYALLTSASIKAPYAYDRVVDDHRPVSMSG
jgi:hypothetical protein